MLILLSETWATTLANLIIGRMRFYSIAFLNSSPIYVQIFKVQKILYQLYLKCLFISQPLANKEKDHCSFDGYKHKKEITTYHLKFFKFE